MIFHFMHEWLIAFAMIALFKLLANINTTKRILGESKKNKRKQKKHGHLPPKEAEGLIWDKLRLDLIGPFKIRHKGKDPLICKCVTMIDPASGWFEIHQYKDKQAITVANITEQEWLSRYPWPTQITFDRGNELIGTCIQTYSGKQLWHKM